ncbi:dTDP-glucose 4,6-dehydratase [Yeosuana sp. MJ-SS3]|uniref:dTDP-glucose 4,6-dehydratase n=1 Tax=Gilvirhabdus luticola TaxID=3079858 RepID=A0ABU3U2N0_9FLAO|nr:dTDP-glucose 4,6-dehydratase [Yeosuana sp. MJ-SS3]MDU8884664.1 dTDP-glucose 4,6-dehydratase [Yeosuana sp. MJ-SS3]
MTILITGGAGFIGSNFIDYFLNKHQNIKIVNLDKLTYAGNLENLNEISNNYRYTFVKGDICDKKLIEKLFNQYNFEGVIHFAAESHVDNSIHSPDEFIKTNIFGTFNLLETAKNNWMNSPHSVKKEHKNSRFHHISTDEVYGSLGETGFFSEKTPYAPNSPYSASKASSDFLVRSYYHTYGLNVVTTNCSNNYGPKQHKEKLIPTIIRKALKGERIPIYGKGTNVRDWLYVLDHCKGIDLVYHKGKIGETYNIGGDNEYQNIDVAKEICEVLDTKIPKNESYKKQITLVEDRPGHDFRYAIDASKIKIELHWEAQENFKSGITKTVNWYINKYKN